MDIRESLERYKDNLALLEIVDIKLLEITRDDMPSLTQTLSDMPKGNYHKESEQERLLLKAEKQVEDKKKRAREEIKVINALLETLHSKKKELMKMRFFQKMSFEEISDTLYYANTGNVRRAITRAVNELQEKYDRI